MTTVLIILLGLFILLSAVLAWRYFNLRRQLHGLADSLRQKPEVNPESQGELEDLAAAVEALREDFQAQLASLNAEHDRLATVLDQMTDGVLIADASGEIQMANPAARRLFESAQPVGRTVTEVVRNHQLVQAWQRCRQTGTLQSELVELPAQRLILQLVVMPDRHGGGSLLLVQDLTRIRRLETVRRDFISNISHQLRTPLASIKALTETLQDGALSDPQAGPRFFGRMLTEVDALNQMTQELLDLSRIESGQAELQLETVSPQRLLASAVDRMRVQAERAGVALQVEPMQALPQVRADPGRLEQVLVNLIHNAIKFSRPGGKVSLRAEPSDGMVRFAVEDHGVGISAEDQPRIFERFYRVDRSRTGSGTGLGLSIARHIIEAHQGQIWVDSLEGQGSTFFFTIPIV